MVNMAKRILVIDDEVDICTLLERLLALEGYEVGVTSDCGDALRLFESEPWDLVLLDIVMPECDGWKVAAALREKRPEVPRCFMTARVDQGYDDAMEQGLIDGYLYKPFSFDDILSLIRRALRPALP